MKELDKEKILEENEKLRQENEKLKEYLNRLENKIVSSIERNNTPNENQYLEMEYDLEDMHSFKEINHNIKLDENEIITKKSIPLQYNYKIPETKLENNKNYLIKKQTLKNEILDRQSNNKETRNSYKEIEPQFDMSIISFLARSYKRVQILKSLTHEDKIPSIISKEIGDENHHVSKHLKSLKEKGLIVCLNEGDKRFRFYSITPKGKKYLKLYERNY